MYEELVAEMKDKLDRKEFFMQNKERKWLEIERILEEYVREDDELRDRLLELRVNVSASSTKKISNVVQENDKLKVQLDNAHDQIQRMRKQLLTIGGLNRDTDIVLDKLEGPTPAKEKVEEDEEEYEEYEDEEYEDEVDEEEAKSAGGIEKYKITDSNLPAQVIAQRFARHKANKKSFMSTAPLSAFIPKQPPGHHLGTIKPKLKVKETKAELKNYYHKLEEALAKQKQIFFELQKDHEILNKTYMKELKKADKANQTMDQIKSLLTKISQKLCAECF